MFLYRDPVKGHRHGRASAPEGRNGAPARFFRTEHLFTFAIGGLGYGLLELAWRGHTHWSMLLCGGLALLMLRYFSGTRLPFLAQCAAGALGITALELAAGLLLNRALGLAVWDYSGIWGNLWGQVCPLYSALWFVLCIPVLGVMRVAWRDPRDAEPLHRR